MIVTVDRNEYSKKDTVGNLYIDGKLKCFTIEDVCRPEGAVKVKGETAIPFGLYKIGLRHSPKFSPIYKHDMLWIQEVPNFQYILIHPGNTRLDTEGCLIIGDRLGIIKGERAVLNSIVTYKKIYPILAEQAKKNNLFIDFIR